MESIVKTDTTEEKILDAAKKVFIHKGMYGARMQEIADEAGINKALLHYYFRSKSKLFEAIFQEIFQEFVPKAFSILKAQIPFDDKIKQFVGNYIDVVTANPYMPGFIINEINQNPDRLGHLTNVMSAIKVEIAADLNSKFESGEYRQIDPIQLFSSVISLTLFPFLARPLIQGAFEYSDEMFREFIQERKQLIPDIILNYLKSKDRS